MSGQHCHNSDRPQRDGSPSGLCKTVSPPAAGGGIPGSRTLPFDPWGRWGEFGGVLDSGQGGPAVSTAPLLRGGSAGPSFPAGEAGAKPGEQKRPAGPAEPVRDH